MKKERAKSQWEVDSILTTAAAPIQELMEKPPVVAARKFVEETCLMTFSIGDTGSKSLEDINSLCVASYPVPGKDHKQVYNNLGWMKMEGNNTMWILLNAAVCAEQVTSALPKGSTKDYLGCTLFVEMLPIVLESNFAKTDKKTGGYPFIFQALCTAFDMNVGAGYWKSINESLPNLKRNCFQLLGKHLLSSPFFPLQAGDELFCNKHPETSFYCLKEDDCNIEMIDRQCQHVARTLDLPYHRPTDIELSGIAQVVGMVPAADNSFKYQTCSKGGKTAAAMKVGVCDPKHKGKGGRARNVLLGHTQWNGDQIQVLLNYVIDNCGSGVQGRQIDWSNWGSDGVEGSKKQAAQDKLQSLKKQYKRMNEGDDRKTNDANIKQFYQMVLAEQLSQQLDNNLFI